MATYTVTLPELLEKRVRKVYFNEYLMQALLYPMVFNVVDSQKAYEDTVKIGGLGSLKQKTEGSPIAYDDPAQSARKRIVHVTFALGFRVSMEMMMDDQFGIIDRMSSDLADATRDHQENLAWSILNNGFATAGGFDSKALMATDHPLLKSSSTYSNMMSPAVALSITGLESLTTRSRKLLNDSGRYTPLIIENLVVPAELEFEAQRILESDYEPFTSDNQINTMQRSRTGMKILCVPYLTSTSSWFLLASKNKHSLTWYRRTKVDYSSGKDSQTKDMLNDVMYRASVTWDDWRGVFGSNP